MASFNKVILAGNIVRDPELRFSPSNLAVARTALAVNSRYKEKDETMFIDIVVFGKQAETLNSYATKGTPVLVEGRLSQNRWEDESGKARYKYEVIVQSFQLLGSRRDRDEMSMGDMGASDDYKVSDKMIEEEDDDIPF